MNNHKISIIIPTLNEECNLPPLILSLYDQEYRPIEVILIDGGSTDETLNITNIYITQLNDPTFTIKSYEEKKFNNITSPANAKNIGLDHTTGDYILFLDTDMKLTSTKTFNTLKNRDKPLDIVKINLIPSEDTRLEKFIKKTIREPSETHMFSHSIINNHRFIPTLGFGEDRYFTQKLLKCSNNITTFPIPIYRHYPHTLTEYKEQGVWYGRTILNYLKVITDKKELTQQLLYILSNVFTTLSVFLIPLSLLISIKLTVLILSLYLTVITIKFYIYNTTTISDFFHLMFLSTFYAIYFTKGLLLSSYNKQSLGRNI